MTGGRPEATGTPRSSGAWGSGALEVPASAIDATRFAHASEAEMARILDFYQVRWEYEPTTFPILWNLDGEVIESFAPDFFLPDLDLFLEMTTLRQRLVRKKNRKLRRLRELYPAIRIKLFYARDFRAMMLKYGRLGLAESLSGSLGQVVPERAAAVDRPVIPAEAAMEIAKAPAPLVEVPEVEVPEIAATVLEAALPVVTSDHRAPRRNRHGRRRRSAGSAAVAIAIGAERETGA